MTMSSLGINDYLHSGVGDILAAIFFAAVFGFLPPNYIINAAAFRNCENACLITWGNILLTCKRFKNVTTPCLQLAKTLCSRVINDCQMRMPVHDAIEWDIGSVPRVRDDASHEIDHRTSYMSFFGFGKSCRQCPDSVHRTDRYIKIVRDCYEFDIKLVIRKNCECEDRATISAFRYCPDHAFVRYSGDYDYCLSNGREEFTRVDDGVRINVTRTISTDTSIIDYIARKACKDGVQKLTCSYTGDVCTSIGVTKNGTKHVLIENTPTKLTVCHFEHYVEIFSIVYGDTLYIGGNRDYSVIWTPVKGITRNACQMEQRAKKSWYDMLPLTYEEGIEFVKKQEALLRKTYT